MLAAAEKRAEYRWTWGDSLGVPGMVTPRSKCCHPGRTTKELDFGNEGQDHPATQKSLVINTSSRNGLYPLPVHPSLLGDTILVENG